MSKTTIEIKTAFEGCAERCDLFLLDFNDYECLHKDICENAGKKIAKLLRQDNPQSNKEYDHSKSVLENIKASNGISREIPKESSDDCISREYMLEKAQEWKNMYPDSDTAREALTMLMNEIDNAPSVVPNKTTGY